jgi:hypothetical protein
MMQRLGDARAGGAARARAHQPRALKERGGTEVKTIGDSFMASFPSAQKAVEARLRCRGI